MNANELAEKLIASPCEYAEQAAQRLAELERDAARYRWLRDTSNPDDPKHMIALHINDAWMETSLSGIDKAMDASMEKQQ